MHVIGDLAISTQLWVLVAGGLAPLVAYVLNHFAPWVSEPTKGIVQAIAAAVAGALAKLIDTGGIGFNDATLQAVVSAMIAAILAHLAYRSAAINVALGAGSNARDKRMPAQETRA